MSSTVHKVLLHGSDIINQNKIVPIGKLSEEASEARNKDFRRFREHHSRKKSRVNSNEDILNFLLLSSDPLISSVRPTMDAKKKKIFFEETLTLLELMFLRKISSTSNNIIMQDRPILNIEILGYSGSALIDTAARRSIAGSTLYRYFRVQII